jgi:hypothetical protein
LSLPTAAKTDKIDIVKEYLDYLDKEMTIMGILSTFCIAALAVVLRATLGAGTDEKHLLTLWEQAKTPVVLSQVLLLAGALWFYRQRSHLAWCYGQIVLSLTSAADPFRDTTDWLHTTDAWSSWLHYRRGFGCLALAVLYALAAALHKNLNGQYWAWHVGLAAYTGFAIVQTGVLNRFAHSNRPWRDAWAQLKRKLVTESN